MNEVTGPYTPTREDWARALDQAGRPVARRVFVVAGVIVAVAVGGFAVERTGGWVVLGSLGAAMAINVLRLGSSTAKRLTGAALGPHTYSVGQYGVRIRTHVALTEVSWRGIESIERRPDAWVLRPASKQPPLVLFRKAFDGERDAQLAAVLHERQLIKT